MWASSRLNASWRTTTPRALVEAAYAMSGANFGWFNVIMANVDAVLAQYEASGQATASNWRLFDAVTRKLGPRG
jgi:hypothetical protein